MRLWSTVVIQLQKPRRALRPRQDAPASVLVVDFIIRSHGRSPLHATMRRVITATQLMQRPASRLQEAVQEGDERFDVRVAQVEAGHERARFDRLRIPHPGGQVLRRVVAACPQPAWCGCRSRSGPGRPVPCAAVPSIGVAGAAGAGRSKISVPRAARSSA